MQGIQWHGVPGSGLAGNKVPIDRYTTTPGEEMRVGDSGAWPLGYR